MNLEIIITEEDYNGFWYFNLYSRKSCNTNSLFKTVAPAPMLKNLQSKNKCMYLKLKFLEASLCHAGRNLSSYRAFL